ncbi:MAG: DUF3151 domain-containing protein [Austwickia sp.]|jgi:hypothetical protein|nr:DUF3151 domain-containing protein [Austwickia sp.]MBK8436513.1 DUF3151 domain-containing protein [Austwickia sp.]MBK9102191.1 DUF3151 domain-containing protein [Austwickia sp.]
MTGDRHQNNLLTQPTLLPPDPAGSQLAEAGLPVERVRDIAAAHPDSALAWALLAQEALAGGRAVEAYAYARTGYHRSLDALRRAGWRGQGHVPWAHEPNQGFLRSLAALGAAAERIGETPEAQRCHQFLADSSAEAARVLGAGG